MAGAVMGVTLALAGAVLLAALPADSTQRPSMRGVAVEVRGGAGTGEFAGSTSGGERAIGPSARIDLSYAVQDRVVAYVGAGQASFGCRGGFCSDAPVDFTAYGVAAGFGVSAGFAWAQAGVLYHALRASWKEPGGGAQSETSSAAPGIEFAVGGAIDLGRGFAVRPGARYMRHAAAFGGAPERERTVHLVADVGIRYRIGRTR